MKKLFWNWTMYWAILAGFEWALTGLVISDGRVPFFTGPPAILFTVVTVFSLVRRFRNGTDEGDHDGTPDPAAGGGASVSAATQLAYYNATRAQQARAGFSSGGGGGTTTAIPWSYNRVLIGGGGGAGGNGGFAYTTLSGQPLTPSRKRFTGKAVDSEAPVYGWRVYTLTDEGVLHGVMQDWPERELQAECRVMPSEAYIDRDSQLRVLLREFPAIYTEWEKVKDTAPNPRRDACISHLEHDSCPGGNGCGIWGRAEPYPGIVMAHCLAYGTVASDEDRNWRASDVRIEALYIYKPAWVEWANSLSAGSHLVTHIQKYFDFDRMAADLYARYGVPVKVIDTLEELDAPVQLLG